MRDRVLKTLLAMVALVVVSGSVHAAEKRIKLEEDTDKGELAVLVDGREAFVYQYGPDEDIAHYWPVRSPSGKSMTVQHPEKYPHHRSFWFANKVKLLGQGVAECYNAWYTKDKNTDWSCPFRDRIRHKKFVEPEKVSLLPEDDKDESRNIAMQLVWEKDWDTTVLVETREMQIIPLEDGEYLLDIVFEVTASEGDVAFVGPPNHQAWPYIEMNSNFDVNDGEGKIVNSKGGINRNGTNGKFAKWVDYSAPAAEGWEGLAIFSHPDNNMPHRWLTRNYGCFGPCRIDKRHRQHFTLQEGESLTRRVGVLVHRGNAESGDVAERYEQYVQGNF